MLLEREEKLGGHVVIEKYKVEDETIPEPGSKWYYRDGTLMQVIETARVITFRPLLGSRFNNGKKVFAKHSETGEVISFPLDQFRRDFTSAVAPFGPLPD